MFGNWAKARVALAFVFGQVGFASAANFNPYEVPPPISQPGPRQAYMKQLVEEYGGQEFSNPPSLRPTTQAVELELVVDYAANVVSGCGVKLRAYNGAIVGPTIRARPGDTLYIRLVNKLPAGVHNPHPQDPAPPDHAAHFSFNITNLHTHGLKHVARGK